MTARDKMPSEQAIVARLTDAGYRTFEAKSVAKQLYVMCQELQGAFTHWWATRELPSAPSFEGFTVESLMNTGKFKQPETAFVFLDWLRSEPVEAKKFFDVPIHRVLVDEH